MDGEIKLVIPQFHNVTRSFTQKINLKNYVTGHDYEMVDFFSSQSEAIPLEQATPEKIAEVSERLYQLAKKEVEDAVGAFIASLRNSSDMPVQLNAAEMALISDIVAEANQATTKTKLTAVKAKATERKPQLSESQLQYLSSLFRKLEAKL